MQQFSIIFILFFCVNVFSTTELNAQSYRKKTKNRFNAGALIGFNLSQIDGDNYRGYDKINPSFGIVGTAFLSKKAELRVELLYLEKGCRTDTRWRADDTKDRTVHLAYMEVPFLFRYRLSDESIYTFVESGFSYARMINSKITEPETPQDGYSFRSLEDDFNRNEFNLLIGGGLQFNKHVSFKLRYGFAFSRFYDNKAEAEGTSIFTPKDIEFLRNYFLMFALQYDL